MAGDHAFSVACGISLGIHLLLLASQLSVFPWQSTTPAPRRALEVVYQPPDASAADPERLRRQALQTARASAGSGSAPATLPAAQIHIPERPALIGQLSLDQALPSSSAVVDLADLMAAAQGDPVLLSYFGAIRQQIQRTANQRAWAPAGEGIICVAFLLTAEGAVRGVQIVRDRSAPVPKLWGIATSIVAAAAPFPPFPPSMEETSKTILVPLEFLLGS